MRQNPLKAAQEVKYTSCAVLLRNCSRESCSLHSSTPPGLIITAASSSRQGQLQDPVVSGYSGDTSRMLESQVVWLWRTDCFLMISSRESSESSSFTLAVFCHPDLTLGRLSSRPGPTTRPETIRVLLRKSVHGRQSDPEQTWKTTRSGNLIYQGRTGTRSNAVRFPLTHCTTPCCLHHRKSKNPNSLGSAQALPTLASPLAATWDLAHPAHLDN